MKKLRCEQATHGSRFGCCHPFQAFALHSGKIKLRAARDAGLDTSTNRGTELLDYDPMTIAQKVFLTRHGERQDMVDKTWHETAENPGDPPLTQSGLLQASQLGVRLKGEKIHHIYASPFLRTVQTAHEVARMINVPIKVEYGLSEGLFPKLFPHGEPRMQTLEELQKEMEHVSLEPWSVWDKINFPEKRKAVEDRVRSTCKKILERHKDENILFVGHGLSVHHVLLTLLADESEMDNIPYCALTECVREKGSDKWEVTCLWEDNHIKEKQDAEDLKAQQESWKDE